jgi:hypothetical protein
MKKAQQVVIYREVYEKYLKGDSLTTDEVVSGARHFYTLGRQLNSLGPEFNNAARPLIMAGIQLQSFAYARGVEINI